MTDFDGLSVQRACRQAPNADAIVTGDLRLSYAELWHQVAGRADALRQQLADWQIAPADRWRPEHSVALAPAVDVPSLVTLLALIELGVPVVLLHPSWTPQERQLALESLGVEHVIDPSTQALDPTPIRSLTGTSAEPAVNAPPMVRVASGGSAEQILALLFTSGSQGMPKAVALSHRAFLASARASAAHLGWAPGDRWLLSLPIAHVGGLSIAVRCLLASQCCVLGAATARGNAEALAEDIQRHDVSLLSLVPTQLRRLLRLSGFELPGRVRVVLVGGGATATEDLTRARARGWPVRTTYGMTEACSQVATEMPGGGKLRILPGIEVRVYEGRIFLRGPTLLSGYALRTGLRSCLDAQGWYRTQDLGRFENDELEIFGRSDAVVVSGGENVNAAEVEQVLLGHPACEAACVVGLPDADWGERVVAIVKLRHPVGEEELKRFGRERLAGFKVPKRILTIDQFPTSQLGKPRRQLLKAWATERLPSEPPSL